MVKISNEKEKADFLEIKYDKEKATFWSANLIDECIKGLAKLSRP